MICTLTEKDGKPNWCSSGCERYHNGHYREYSQDPGPKGQKFRQYWRSQRRIDPAIPSLAKRAIHYAADLQKHIATGSVIVPSQVRQYRWSKCEPCPHRNREHNVCAACGCPLKQTILGDALAWASKSCPKGYFPEWSKDMPHHWELTPESPIAWTKQLLEQPPGPWPDGFTGFPSVINAFQELLKHYAQHPAPIPSFPQDRGIVICGGGWKFFPSIYVTVRTIRHIGCNLPIQVWYLGDKNEFDARMAQALQPYRVGWIDANSFHRENPHTGVRRPIDHGWQLKPYAACYAPFKEVIALDADSVPVRSLDDILNHHEYQRVGACFFPDQAPLHPSQWERFGLPPCGLPGLESGQFIVDKSRHWRPLWLARWMNDYYEYVWHLDSMGLKGHLYGDKDTFAIAWQACGHEMCVPTSRPGFESGAFLQYNFEGNVQFVHYTRNKFKLPGDLDGMPINSDYYTSQNVANDKGRRNAIPASALPLNKEGHKFLNECDELLRPEKHFEFIQGERGWCRDIWDGVTLRNEYQMPGSGLGGGLVIDLGANVGAFSHWALLRGASKVIAVEPWGDNLPVLRKNLKRWGSKVAFVDRAVWKERSKMRLSSHDQHIAGNTSTISLVGNVGDVQVVPTVTLDELIGNETIRLIKIDIEGAEGPVMAACTKWHQVQEVTGETHEGVVLDGVTWTHVEIGEILRQVGFQVRFEKNGPSTYLFWGTR